MSLTQAQRREQNRLNAQKSTGPKSKEGKNISRFNSLVHGLAAEALTLPDETPEELDAQSNAWHDACQPEGHDEETLVGQLALTSIRLGRLAKAEAATITEQVRMAESRWEREQELMLVECTRLMRTDPALALIELKRFGAGVEWMIERWIGLQEAFKKFECWNNLSLIKDAIRLQGGDPEQMRYEPLQVQEFALVACSCIEGYADVPAIASFLSVRSPEWVGRYPNLTCPTAKARELIAGHIEQQIADLTEYHEAVKKSEESARATAGTRASSPDDTPRNRLMYRYLRSAESTLDRTLKTLQKLQSERAKAIARESKEKKRNEPKVESEPPSKPVSASTSVKPRGVIPEVSEAEAETTDGAGSPGASEATGRGFERRFRQAG